MSEALAVTVVVLTFNSAEYLPVCLAELERARGVTLEVIVVDNASKDDSAAIGDTSPVVDRTICCERNLGCAGGNNVGWRAASHPIVLFLNPDCALDRDAVRRMANPLAEDPRVGLTGCRLYYPNSRLIQHAGGILHPNAMAEHIGMGEEDDGRFGEDLDLEYVTGAAFAVRRSDLEALGGFDEDFNPAYYEETDLCTRLRRSGLIVRYVASAIGWHHESVGLEKGSREFIETSYRRRIVYVVKNYSLAEWLTRFWPFEIRWVLGPHAHGYRRAWLDSHVRGAAFALKCLPRFSRRPRGVQARLARGKEAR